MPITHITTLSQLDDILSKSKDKLSVIDFHATWCRPCHMIAGYYKSLSNEYKDVNFLKCDVDAVKEVASKYRVKAMPTFVFLKGTTQVHVVQGADRAALQNAVSRYSSGSPAGSFAGKGQTLGGQPSSPQLNGSNVFPDLSKIDPQVKVFLCLVAGYIAFWYLS